ncbi:hypothetical protein [Streptomyces fructofermentans]|uniref:Uncharacterized protein n=1 Tax=Streptomyces fructofermentans TaxID=152141 RepID=A0A918NS12_9ACTN|nr:hypothetical protein [Streptomyces fructofermentans]GGX90737.1 hypothetical protein GCM10010515_67340 [Streptomyces fructofermentans]
MRQMVDDGQPALPPEQDAGALADRLKERIYATITMIAVVVGLSLGHAGPTGALATVLTTALGLWLAAFVADQQAHRTVHRHLATGRELRRMLYVSSPLLSCAVGPAVMIALAALDVLSLSAALLTSAGLGVVSLFIWGCTGGVRMGGGLLLATLAGLLDAAIGVAVVLVKVSAGH